ncbi:hypothetical protein B0H14DRAFT_3424587 [Mycena olivaceomarginata]|nr:hypothetical protein B0H14DRAFT_3424587 [Mycena olivaceomarginata]
MSSLPSRHHGARPRAIHRGTHGIPCGQRQRVHGPLRRDLTRAARVPVLASYQPKESDPDDEKKMGYVPVWLDDADVLGTMRGIDIASSARRLPGHYKSYAPANNVFARAVAKEWREGDLVWWATHEQQRTHAPRRGALVVAIAEGDGDGDEGEGDGDGDGHKIELRLRTLAACNTSTNDNDRVARRARTADTRQRCFLLIPIPIPMPIPIALPLCLPPSPPPSLPPSLFSDTYTRRSSYRVCRGFIHNARPQEMGETREMGMGMGSRRA